MTILETWPVGPPAALYLHIPFCVSVCPYCDFVVYPGAAARGTRNRIAAFADALLAEIALRAEALDARFGRTRTPLGSVYLGGGTPSLLPADTIAAILGAVRDRFGVARHAEITLEANPGADEMGDLRAAKSAGVNRISFGAQSLHPGELRRLGRRHSPSDVGAAVDAARRAGIASVSLDLLYDVPGQTEASWAASLEAALALEPDHLSLYALTLDDPRAEGLTGVDGDHLPPTAGALRWRARAAVEQDEDRAAAQYLHAVDRLGAAGWHAYEISNWSKPGHESRHNLAYWRRLPYEAVGPGAHAFDGRVRRWNAARLEGYLAALRPPTGDAPRLPPGGCEIVDEQAAAAESAILGLRTDDGVAAEEATRPPLVAQLDWAVEHGLVASGPDHRIRLTPRGRLLSNELFLRLI